MKRSTLLAAALAAVAFPALAADPLPRARPESVGMSSERLQRLTEAIKAEVDQGRIPGAVIAVARKGRLVYYEAIGQLDKATNTPMRTDAIFPIASMTKPMVVVGALMLYEQNRMLVNAPVSTYLPQLAKMQVAVMRTGADGKMVMQSEPALRQPAILDLMRHTAGMTYGNRGATEWHKMYPQSSNGSANMPGVEFLDKLANLPLQYQPGSKWDYSLGVDVLGFAVEAVTNQSLGQYLEEQLFRPLAMRDTGFVVPAENARRLARPLATDPATGKPMTVPDRTRATKWECGGGCAASTAGDYIRFTQMLLNGGRLGDTRILGRKTVEYMTADHLGLEVDIDVLRNWPNINGYGHGLGVVVRRGYAASGYMGSPGEYHWQGAFGTYFWVDPREQLVAVLMANTPGHPAIRNRNRQVVNALVYQSIVD